ncbi:Protein CBG04403 [Caenorhabditis briggsae]|uniref:Protein CBG04403 n=1 Tax=Caenorhabditis briggsae TaxID=6238 RepID=A8WXG3_CAEBR|nr:Protein CBG04403 [Caenorhabditis briggsae]CAP25110.2 Protein CBG04403 [Caenorhabditis briggsae]
MIKLILFYLIVFNHQQINHCAQMMRIQCSLLIWSSLSNQHSKWHGTIPNGAPKTYDVVACFDYYCKSWRPLVSNCKYSQNKSNEIEQVCNIHLLNVPLIRTVQFRFRENYGDTKMTCVNLLYHNSYSTYFLRKKSCTVLYENDRCSECPECCQECLISDYNGETLLFIFSSAILIFMIFGVFAILMSVA